MITVSLQGGIAMIEKWKKWVLKMNLKRAALIFVVSSVVLILVLLAAMHGVFLPDDSRPHTRQVSVLPLIRRQESRHLPRIAILLFSQKNLPFFVAEYQ